MHRLLASISLFFVLCGSAHAIDLQDDIFVDRRLGLRLPLPEGWVLSRHTGYPAVIAILTRPGTSAQLSLAVIEGLPPPIDLSALTHQQARVMAQAGVTVVSILPVETRERRVWRVVAHGKASKRSSATREVRQLYFSPSADRIFILTLSATTAELKSTLPDLSYTMDNLEFATRSTAPTSTTPVIIEDRPTSAQ